MAPGTFREFVPPSDWPKRKVLSSATVESWCQHCRDNPRVGPFVESLEFKNIPRPFIGVTSDGNVRKDVLKYAGDEGAPTAAMVMAANNILFATTDEEKQDFVFESLDVDELRLWSNPEIYINPGGIRLDRCSEKVRNLIHQLLKASMSPTGYKKVYGCCVVNGFLGSLLGGEAVLNEHSYNFRLFGQPDQTKPWGYTFFGHHVCIAVVIKGNRMVIGPTFLGAEPDHIDQGPHEGLRLFQSEEIVALQLMWSLRQELQKKASLFHTVDAGLLPAHRWKMFDERHVGGARQDNRVIPFEGCRASEMTDLQRSMLSAIFCSFNEYYPEPVLAHRLAEFEAHFDETYFAWIGGTGEDDPYYYRVHSPVAFMEFDFHCGVFLTNTTPRKFHIHTINRVPNGGDYGMALVRQ